MDEFSITIDKKKNLTKNSIQFDIQGNPDMGLDKSIVNSIRRTLLTSIDTVGFRTDINNSDIVVVENNTSLHNEYLLHRISLIPLYIDPDTYQKNYLFYLKVSSNLEEPIKIISMVDFDIYPLKDDIDIETITEIKLDNYKINDKDKLSNQEKKEIFRPYNFDGKDEYCILTELKLTNSYETNQTLELYGCPSISQGYENSRWQSVSCISYHFKKDNQLFNKILQEKILIEKIPDDKIDNFKNELEISESERYFYRDKSYEPYWYEFLIESCHKWDSKQLFIKSTEIIIDQLTILKNEFPKISNKEDSILDFTLVKENIYHLTIQNFDDTIGNILQSHISRYLINQESILSFCGYKKIHPLKNEIMIILSLNLNHKKLKDKNLTYKTSVIIDILIESCNQLINIYELIKNEAIHNL